MRYYLFPGHTILLLTREQEKEAERERERKRKGEWKTPTIIRYALLNMIFMNII